MFVIPAEEAKKHIEPPRLAALIVSPSQSTVELGKKQTFTAKGLDQHGRDIDVGHVTWSATGDKVYADGVFQAGVDEGNFLVTAMVGSVRGTSSVTVAKTGVISPPPGKPSVKEPTGLPWEGQVSAQKWMNFYTKVLSKFAVSTALPCEEIVPPL